jgi:hypothetical protein
MRSDYHFSLTPRLIALALFGGVALMVLLFALGYQVGRQIAQGEQPPAASGAGRSAAGLLQRAPAGLAQPLAQPLGQPNPAWKTQP